MSKLVEVTLPDIGDFDAVDVIEVLVSPGDTVEKEASLITLETDKATMEVPAPQAGTIKGIMIKVGDKIAKNGLILTMEVTDTAAEKDPAQPAATHTAPVAATATAPVAAPDMDADRHTEVLVIGAGPGGYTAAFRAADLGKQVTLVERYPTLGGVCLNVGCIPSKALLHTAEVINSAAAMAAHGVSFGEPVIDLDRLRGFKDEVVGKLTGGLAALAKRRKVQVIEGTATFVSANVVAIKTADGESTLSFDNAIIAAGSEAMRIPVVPDDPRVIDSTGALELTDIPGSLLVIGGGIIGLEVATVYAALGTKITVVEMTDGLMPGCDADLVRPLMQGIRKRYENIYIGTKVIKSEARDGGIEVFFEGGKAPASAIFDKVLVATGRRPNGARIGAENAGIGVDEGGFIPVDHQQRTNVDHIFAIGDIVGQPMLAHKATHEGKVAAEVISGMKSAFEARTIPSVAYTDPEIAWMGLTEIEAKANNIDYEKSVFPWAASGRALGMGRDDGITKLLFEKGTGKLLGAGITGLHAGDLIAEVVVAFEMGADAADIALSIHPHPTLSESIAMAAEAFEGTITDLYIPKRK